MTFDFDDDFDQPQKVECREPGSRAGFVIRESGRIIIRPYNTIIELLND